MQSIAEDEKSQDNDIDKELELQHESTIIDSLNNNSISNLNNNKLNDSNTVIEHKRCVPLQVYQKVYQDKQKLLSEINNLNTEIKNLNQSSKVANLENEVKILKRDINNYENALIKQ